VVKESVAGHFWIKTVFRKFDYPLNSDSTPKLFESVRYANDARLCRLPPRDWRNETYSTWDEAVAGHDRLVALLSGKAAKGAAE
jgi:hypothetical protein